jgi:hypothetical protein
LTDQNWSFWEQHHYVNSLYQFFCGLNPSIAESRPFFYYICVVSQRKEQVFIFRPEKRDMKEVDVVAAAFSLLNGLE